MAQGGKPMMTQQAPQAVPATMQQPLLERVRAAGLRLLGFMMPSLTTGGACPSCRASLALVDDHLIEWNESGQLYGMRFWECANCQYTTGQCYIYSFRDGEFWACWCC
jgi:hypothetical protein